jgi:catechol 2,3-dioxygenase-like lactoylglutathione lyase family enzyme
MALVNDLHHIAFLTADMDRLISFYGAFSTHD